MRKLFKFKYPKVALLILAIIFSYAIFADQSIQQKIENLDSLKYAGIFIAGFFFSFGFTTPFAVGFFITSNPSNILLAAVIGGLGAALADLTIFKIIRFSFMDEFKKIENTKLIKRIIKEIESEIPKKFRVYLLYAFSGIVIASPLPDEFGVTMLAGLSNIKTIKLIAVSYFCNTIGILVMLIL